MARAYDPGLLELEEEAGAMWTNRFVQSQPEGESVRLPALDPRPFGGNSQLQAEARQLAQLRGSRVVNTEVERQYRRALQAAERAARRARSKIAAARAAVPRPNPVQVQAQATAEYEAWLGEDYRLTIEGARARYGENWRKQMVRLPGPNERQAYYDNQLAQVSRAWLISRREQLDFNTLAASNVRSLPQSFRPPAAEVERVVSPLIPGSREEPVAPIVVRFVQELKNRYRGFSASTYRNHGGGAFLRRGYSIDLFLNGPRDDRGFYPRSAAEAFLRQVHETARAVNVEWRALYNDFSVADAINRSTGVRHVVFIGSPRTAQRSGRKYGTGLNWHGPHPLILHFHLDIVPLDTMTATGSSAPRASASGGRELEQRFLHAEHESEWFQEATASPGPCSGVGIKRREPPNHSRLERGVVVMRRARFAPACNNPLDLILAPTVAAEGSYDSVNMYDRGIISWGILQSAAHAGSLQALLSFIKQQRPDVFQRYFGRYGLDVVAGQFFYQGRAHPIEQRRPGGPVPNNTALRLLFRGRAERGAYDDQVIRRWATIFACAGRDPAVQELQMQFARRAVARALDMRHPMLRGQSPGQLLRGNVTAQAIFFSLRVNNPRQAYRDLQSAVDAAGGPQAGPDRIASAFFTVVNNSTFNRGLWQQRARGVPNALNLARARCRGGARTERLTESELLAYQDPVLCQQLINRYCASVSQVWQLHRDIANKKSQLDTAEFWSNRWQCRNLPPALRKNQKAVKTCQDQIAKIERIRAELSAAEQLKAEIEQKLPEFLREARSCSNQSMPC